MEDKKRYLITSALPYVNTVKHLGNLVSSLLPADILARYLRQRGEEVLAVCGTDDHGTPAEVSALEAGMPVEKYVEQMSKKQKDIYERFGLSYDIFSRTHTQENAELTQDLFLKLHEKGHIKEKEVQSLYCINCKRNLPDRYVVGTCPNCKYEHARGDQCENCSKVLDGIDLINPKCIICGESNTEIRNEKHLFLDLGGLEGKIKAWVDTHKDWPKTTLSIANSWLKEGLRPRSISRNIKWGIPIPLDGHRDKVFYVWFDAPIGYISITKQWAKQQGKPKLWEKYWKDPDTYLINFIGKDNVPFHVITFPATLTGADDGIILANYVKAFQWLNYERSKFSSSQGVGIFTDTALELYPADYWRYYIMKIAPERHDTDFLWTEFRDSINNDLADILGNFVHRTLTFINNNFEGKIPVRSKLEKEDKDILSFLEKAAKKADSEMRKLEFQRTLLAIFDFARECNKYFQSKKPWADVKNKNIKRAATTLSICAQCSRGLAVLLAPYIPFSTEEIFEQLNLKENIHKQSWFSVTEEILDGHKVKQDIHPIFKKIELEEIIELGLKWGSESIKELLEKNPNLDPLKKKKKHAPKKEEQKKKVEKVTKELISYKEFQKLDLRVGTIKTIEPIKDANKLVKIIVDIGTEERQIVAGIAERYKPEELIGKQIIIIVNLEPAKIRGVESNGMLLAADADPEISVLIPLRKVPDGSKVR
ncbi:MAG: methionine--tRNA ligase [Candidatus Heimdallarchaeota archaeon]|nr:methionine--tRNA ligase [Candidatus Heimdallarchaeota archaeon]MCK4291356.1 methionine--tRNA ligase [Candidatus Heimdallarchaeota archaeon]